MVSLCVILAAVLMAAADVAVARNEWDTVRHQPIVDGESLAGIQLGDSIEDATRKLGIAPADVFPENLTSRMEYLYLINGVNDDWMLAITATITIAGARIEAIHMTVLRRNVGITAYGGRTTKGYRPGESITRLRALYGPPDEIMQFTAASPVTPVWWWYRRAGLIVSPEIEADRFASQIAIVRPGLTAAEVRRLVLPP